MGKGERGWGYSVLVWGGNLGEGVGECRAWCVGAWCGSVGGAVGA